MLVWISFLVVIAVEQSEGASRTPKSPQPCQGSGEPCVEFIKEINFCGQDDIKQAAPARPLDFEDEDSLDLYPWWIEEGSKRRLCCDVKVSQPLLNTTITLEWYYYKQLDTFGSRGYTVVQNSSDYTISQELRLYRYRLLGYLEINNATQENGGAYACRATASTKPPAGVQNAAALSIGRLSEPIVIKVYSEKLEFVKDDDYHSQHRTVNINNLNKPDGSISYALKSVNPRKKLVVTVDTDGSLLQYIDIRDVYTMVISAFGDRDYEESFNKDFTVTLYYEGEKDNQTIQRTWSVTGLYLKDVDKDIVKPTLEFNDRREFHKPFPFFVIGSCPKFVYTVQLDDGDEQELSFDPSFPDTYNEITDGAYTLQYKFTNSYCSGELAKKNSYVEFNLTRSDYEIDTEGYNGNTYLKVTVGCTGQGSIGPETINFRGLPLFPSNYKASTADRNCLSYNQTGSQGYIAVPPVGNFFTNKHLCCRTQGNLYPNTYLWFNGQLLDENDERFKNFPPNIRDVVIEPLYDAEKDKKRYAWFEKYSGYYQCIVGKYSYQIESGSLEPQYSAVKARTFRIGFKRNGFNGELSIDLENARSYLPEAIDEDPKIQSNRERRNTKKGDKKEQQLRDVTNFQVKISDTNLMVINGSCVQLSAVGVTFPHQIISWETSSDVELYSDSACSDPYVEETILFSSDNYEDENPSIKYSYDPYDKVTISSPVFVGPIDKDKTTVTVKMGDLDHDIKITPRSPFLEKPVIRFAPPESATSITCTVKGYPIENASLVSRDKKNVAKPIATFDVKLANDENRVTNEPETNMIYLTGSVQKGMETVECEAHNSFVQGEAGTLQAVMEIPKEDTSDDVMLIVVAVIGIALLVLVLWIICACVAMARNPLLKFWDAMCCKTGPYSKVEKIQMDPYKLEYFTLNPSVTLGGGHFGIVRRGFCNVIPDRSGERTEIAIKEVKPCIDRLRREEDLRRERDIMMRLRSHSNVLRIYGYTDEPDQLALVMEFAAFGSLDKLLVEARKIKSDGYLMPNEQIENPIKAFESHHIVDFGKQISDGMAYIGRNQIVHRDLAARNIVVAGEGGDYVLKITDFGLAREICDDGFYERVEGKEIPIKWTAPESLRGNIYTPKSDVWSYGITLWEICTLGGEPYSGYSNAETMEKLRSGYRLQKPPSCNTDLYNLMGQCWLELPDDRPDFEHILSQLTNFSQKPSDYVHIDSLYETDLNLTLRLQTLQPPAVGNNHHAASTSSPPRSPVREQVSGGAGSRDSCNSPRDYHQPADDAAGSMAQNAYSMEPSNLPNNAAV
ncbi:hypothetical protein ACHWQZ_G001391 [Mnemiopsis leidyi]